MVVKEELENFRKNKRKKQVILGSIIGVMVAIGAITLFKTFAFYEEKRNFNIIMGRIPDFEKGDIQLAFTIDGVKGAVFPGRNSGYIGKNVTCENGVTAVWNNELWGIVNVNSNGNAKVICNVEFQPASTIKEAKIGDYVSYTPEKTSYEIESSHTDISSQDPINPSELNLWRIIKKNEDGTIELVSVNTSNQLVEFHGQIGYDNFVKELNRLATGYETSGITSGSRYMGYEEQKNGELYKEDIKLVEEACNGLQSSSDYFIGSRISQVNDYGDVLEFYYIVRYVTSSGDMKDRLLYYKMSPNEDIYNVSYSLRPIVILKSGIASISGNGSNENPWKVN